ncbi:hypothetical protein ES703_06681 [subsurface metagenome]
MDLTEGERRHRVGTKGYKNALLSAFIVALLLTSAALPVLGWTSLTSASPTPNAKTKLEGFDKTAGKWSTGNLTGWKELDWVPYRIKFRDLPEGTSSYTFNVYHNNLLDDKDGVDRLRGFHVGDEDGNPVTGSVTVSGPFYNIYGKGDQDIYYTILVSFTTPAPKLTWYLYWQAHLAFGASGWPGSSLHAYADISGKGSVSINVPPTPIGSISGYKWHDLNRDGVWSLDEPELSGWTIRLYRFEEHAWNHLADKNTDSAGSYTFSLVAGNYRLCEVLKDDWTQTFPPSGCHEVVISEGETRGNINFGNFLAVVPVPTVTTRAATGVNATQATMNADFTVSGYDSVGVWFQYRVQGGDTWIETSPATYTASGSHSDDVTGLSPDTTYEFRAALQYDTEKIYGDILTFTTSKVIPTVTTRAATGITATQAIMNADFTVGIYDSVNVWFQYRVQGEDTWIETSHTTYTASGSHSDDATGLSPDTTYEFKACLQYDTEKIYGDALTFTTKAVQPPSAPTLKSPADGTITNDNTPYFEWIVGANADNHRLLVDSDPDFSSPEENRIVLDNYYTITDGNSLPDDNYSWKVIAINAFGENESSTRTFLIDTIAPPTPTLGSPENNAVESALTQTFTWTEPEAGVTYDIQIDNETSFTSPYVHENTCLTDNSYTYTFASNSVYYWRVRAVDAATNQSSWSDKFKLTIQAPPRQPTPNLPTDGAITNDNIPTFEWTVGANADNHRLLVDNDSDFTPPIENRLFGPTDNTYTLENSLPDDNYSWKVVAINLLGENQSPVWTFVIDTVPPGAPGWGSPDGTTDDNTPTFDWPDVPDAENYDFLIDGIQVTISVSTYTLTVELPDGTYSWKVRARDAAGNVGDWSSTWTLIIKTIVRGVEVSISPGSKSGGPGETLSYTVNVKNEGNISDTYALTVADSAGWGPTLSKDSLEVDPQSYETVALTVTIPSGASLGTQDTITITAKSTQDPTVSDSASCTAKAMVQMGVEVSISPDSKSGAPEETLTYDVTVKNTGSIDDTYTLSAVGAEGWSISIEPTSLILAADATGEATLSVVVPPDASENDSMTVTVSAISEAYPSVTGSDTCRTVVKGVPVVPGVGLALPLAILALLILLLILLLAYLLRRRRRGGARRRVLRDVCLGLGAALLAMIYLLAGRRRAARRSVFKDASPAPRRWVGDRDC